MKILFIGDIVGRPGRQIVELFLPGLKREYKIDLVIANGENASGGVGIAPHNAKTLLNAGVDFFTSGNHIFQSRDYEELFETFPGIIRPANYPDFIPGKGYKVIDLSKNLQVAVINLIGRTFMQPVDCPFLKVDQILSELDKNIRIRIVDFHAEATSEKIAMGIYLNGRVSAVLGTHTHVQTADEQILDKGTAYITDVGMAGPVNSVIGVEQDSILKRFLTGLPVKFTVARGPARLDYVVMDIDNSTGKAVKIERFCLKKEKE